ncbi:MAG: hypothetical protein HKM01_01140 [Gallionella sp.]|nr:hypothetical protein [Gallionella sp.]
MYINNDQMHEVNAHNILIPEAGSFHIMDWCFSHPRAPMLGRTRKSQLTFGLTGFMLEARPRIELG